MKVVSKSYKNINEATIGQAAAEAERDLENPTVISNSGDIEDALDEALDDALYEQASGGKDYPNVLFVGAAGTGKSARIKAWAAKNRINLVTKLASTLDDTDLGGAVAPSEDRLHAVKLRTTEFDTLGDVPRSVLFLDEFNRAPRTVRGTLLTLIQDHIIPDASEKSGVRFLKNFLFTVAAINPADANYNTDELDDAEKSRFRKVDVQPSSSNLLKYLKSELQRQLQAYAETNPDREKFAKRSQIAAGQIGIAEALLTNKYFHFDNAKEIDDSKDHGNGLILTYRTFTNLLKHSNGTKQDFLNKWDNYCNSTKKSVVEMILKNYEDVKDKANAVLEKSTESSVFGAHKESDYEKLSKYIDSLTD